MNGEKAVHIVDRKAQKARAINRKVSKKVFGKQRSLDEWRFVPPSYIYGLKLVWNVVLIPVVLVAAVLEGIRAGFIAGMQKALALYRM